MFPDELLLDELFPDELDELDEVSIEPPAPLLLLPLLVLWVSSLQ